MNDRHRLRMICTDGCGTTLMIRVNGASDVGPHLHKLRIVIADIAAADGWLGGRCPTCRRWARGSEPAADVAIGPSPVIVEPMDLSLVSVALPVACRIVDGYCEAHGRGAGFGACPDAGAPAPARMPAHVEAMATADGEHEARCMCAGAGCALRVSR